MGENCPKSSLPEIQEPGGIYRLREAPRVENWRMAPLYCRVSRVFAAIRALLARRRLVQPAGLSPCWFLLLVSG